MLGHAQTRYVLTPIATPWGYVGVCNGMRLTSRRRVGLFGSMECMASCSDIERGYCGC